MRILFASVYPHLPDIVGGLQTTTDNFCIALRDAGIEVAVLCGSSGNFYQNRSFRDESLGYPVIRTSDPVSALPHIAAGWNPSVIVVQSGPTLLPMVLRSLEIKIPTAVYLHNVEPHQLGGFLAPDARISYIANSHFTAKRWKLLCNIDCVVIPPLVLPERYFVTSDGDHVLYVNPVPIKGVEIMFKLAALCTDINFLVAESWGLDTGWRDHCLARCQRHRNIRWSEPVQDMRRLYQQTRTLLMPSIWEESYGRTAVEAQVCGIPVVASNRGALPETVGSGGILVDLDAPLSTWERALRRAHLPSREYDAMSRAARENSFKTAATALLVGRLLTLLSAHISAGSSA